MGTRRIVERFTFTGGRVRRDGPYPVIEGVLLCGGTSANRRRYRREAFAGDRIKRYEGRPVYIDHGPASGTRGYRDQVGWVEKPRLRGDGMPVGDIALKPTHPDTPSILFDAEHRPANCGMSHVAHCKTGRSADGWEDVDEVVEVESVDVVVDPATTRGLFENRRAAVSAITIREFAEQFSRHPKATSGQILKVKRLAEMEEVGPVAMDPPAEDADPAAGVKDAFMAAIVHLVDQCLEGGGDSKDCLKKIKKLIDSHGEVKGGSSGGGGGEEGEEGEEEETFEGRKPRRADPYQILAECERHGYRPGPAELKALALMTESERAAFVTEQRKKASPAERPQGQTRRPGAGTAGNTNGAGGDIKAEEGRKAIPDWDDL